MRKLTQHIGFAAPIRCCKKAFLTTIALAAMIGSAAAGTVTVTVVDDGASNIGAPGTFYWALTNCHPGDTIAFNIDSGVNGAGPYYFMEPPGGFPIIHKLNNLLIDGYTQPGCSPNTGSMTQPNNAVIKIVIDGRNANDINMFSPSYTTNNTVPPIDNTGETNVLRNGFGESERALLAVYRSTNVWIRGLAFFGTFGSSQNGWVQKGICFARDYDHDQTIYTEAQVRTLQAYASGSDFHGHVSGCWFGIDPAYPNDLSKIGGAYSWITHYRCRDVNDSRRPSLPNNGLIIGVAPGSTNPAAEFNVFVGGGYQVDGVGIRQRFTGNRVGIMPDGVTAWNPSQFSAPLGLYDWGTWQHGFIEWGRFDDTEPTYIGTDGDGVNDAWEGNQFGPIDGAGGVVNQPTVLDMYNTSVKTYIIAGNRFGVDIHGTPFPHCSYNLANFAMNQGSQIRFGSDFNGVSDDLEANIVYNNNPDMGLGYAPSSIQEALNSGPGAITNAWFSARGNVMVNNYPLFNPDDSTASRFVNWWSNFVAYAAAPVVPDASIPVLAGSSTISTLSGTFLPPSHGFTNLVLDLYVPDPLGLANGIPFALPSFPSGFVQGKTYLGSFLIPNPSSGAFALDISGLGLAHGTKVTAAITYSSFARPNITSATRTGNSTTLTWTGDNGGPYTLGTHDTGVSGIQPALSGGPAGFFNVQSASAVTGPYTTAGVTLNNTTTITDNASARFYRIAAPVAGMTTLCTLPVTLP
ncbi:MAG: hypothetical protein NT167_31005 [Verrucomicrobia bacterium]|nr:hypothetical protein [Verrucomicrobiota bacterium]